jgi:SAM-dependent methyltransferase
MAEGPRALAEPQPGCPGRAPDAGTSQPGQNQEMASNRWMAGDAPRGDAYDRRFDELAARAVDMHGEADLIDSYDPASVLDAGCGTGRVAIELGRRGRAVSGVDLDPRMLEVARRKAPAISWVEGDLADPGLALDRQFDVVAMAGNVLIFVAPGTEGSVLSNMVRWLVPGGRLIAGYSLLPDRLSVAHHDVLAQQAGLTLESRWSTWDCQPFAPDSGYAVSVHRLH